MFEGDPVGVGDTAVTRAGFEREAVDEEFLFVFGEEVGCFGGVGEKAPDKEGEEDGDEPFDDLSGEEVVSKWFEQSGSHSRAPKRNWAR